MSQPKIPKIKMPGMSTLQMPRPLLNVSFNPQIFEDQINSQGLRMVHQRPVPCPNVLDVTQPSHNPACNACFNGFVYYDYREFVGAFQGNDLQRQFNMNGTWDIDQATIIIPVKDKLGNIMDVQYFDQIIVPDVSVRYYQRVEHSQSGVDRLQFPALTVDFLLDANFKRYAPNVDFVVEQGRIRWITNNRPGYNPTLSRGTIYSVNYYTRPVFTVVGLPHQIRAVQTQSEEGAGSPNVEARFPQLCVVRKDFIPYDRADHTGEPDRPEPPSGSFA